VLDLGEGNDSGSEGVGLVDRARALGGTDFDNRTTFRFALAVLSISGSNYRSTERPLPRINSKIP